ncbi:MAG: hypothetical protein AABY22_27745 [Nanoarchaeota archaeon]
MQQAELLEILPELKAKVESYKLYGTTIPTDKDIKIAECRAYNLKLKDEQEAKREYWRKVQEARAYNLSLRFKQQQQRENEQDIKIYELVKANPQILSSVR